MTPDEIAAEEFVAKFYGIAEPWPEVLVKLGSVALDMREAVAFGIAHARTQSPPVPVELVEAVRPFVKIVRDSSGRIPTEKLSFADWDRLCKAFKQLDSILPAVGEKK